jgi:hypothetical protein
VLRTCDATGACLAVPDTPHYRQALTVLNVAVAGSLVLYRLAGLA